MSELRLRGSVRTALSHLTLYGLAAILDDAGVAGVRVAWIGALDPRPVVTAPGLDPRLVGDAVREHAVRHTVARDWVEDGLMSPRMTLRRDQDGWDLLARQRASTIDDLLRERRWLDLRLTGALGEPAHWRFDRQRQRLPDEGASRWEMKTRNRGEEFVGDRLRKLARSVASRDPARIVDGLTGAITVDEVGGDANDSRTATGLAGPGPTDNAAAWCALWGISLFPLIHLVTSRSRTAGHLEGARGSGARRGWFYLPVPGGPMGLPRLRSVMASRQLATVAGPDPGAAPASAADALDARTARGWLVARGIGALVRFPIGEYGSANAPERRALEGTPIALQSAP